ncbi:MAG: type I-U CRISPR-associated protein Cas5/Cas6 [Limnochordaceae bacterium]|nr:type I-U CRISPR-associated protein Cas5/Cas6 [Limnochordaceae bacterium]
MVPGIATVAVARFLLHGKVLPPVTEILSLGDAARRAAMSWFGRLNGKRPSPVLSGKDTTGSPLQGHRHAFYLPTDEDKDGYLDHLTIWVKDGLPRAEVEALASVPEIQWGKADESTVRLTLLGFADEELAERMAPALFARSRRWVSFSPFVLVRHSKLRKQSMPGGQGVRVVDGPIDQLRRELRNHGFEGSDVEVRERPPVRGHWAEFRRRRRTGPPPAGGGYGFELTFPSAVKGPIALGYGCHFGLGLFLAVP